MAESYEQLDRERNRLRNELAALRKEMDAIKDVLGKIQSKARYISTITIAALSETEGEKNGS